VTAPGINVGSVGVTVVPDTRRFVPTLRRDLNPVAKSIGEDIGRQISDGIAKNLKNPKVQVDADTAGASGKLDRVGAQADRLGRSSPTINVDVDTAGANAQLSALESRIAFAGVGMAGLVSAGLLLGSALVPAAGAAAVAVAGIGTAAIGAGAGLGVMFLGFSGVGDAVKALGAAQLAAGKDAASAAARQLSLANSADQVRNAEQNLTRAQGQAKTAQQDLTRARQDARRAMQDLALQVRGGALAQRQANLDVARAKMELDRVSADPKSTALERQQAQLSYEQAVQQLDEQTVRTQRLRQEKAASDRAGVNGSRQVVDAQQRVAAANDTVRQAQQSVVSAQRSLERASVTAGAAASAAMVKLRQSMDNLSPAGQAFARFLFSLKPRLDALRATAQAGLLPGVEAGIRSLLPYFPQLNRFVAAAARVLGDMFAAAGRALTSPFWREFFGFLAENALPALRQMGAVVGNLATGLAAMFMAFNPAAKDFGDGLVGLTARFAAWAKGLKDNRGFQEFLAYIRENGPRVVAMLGSLFRGLENVVRALAPIGGTAIAGLERLGNIISAIPAKDLTIIAVGISAVAAAVFLTNIALALIATPVLAVIAAIGALGVAVVLAYNRFPVFRRVVEATWQAIVDATKWAWEKVIKPVFAALVWFYENVVAPVVMWLWNNVFKPVFDAIGGAAKSVWDNFLHPIFTAIAWTIEHVLGPIFMWLWHDEIEPVWNGIKIVISVAWAVIKVIFGLLQIAIKILVGIFRGFFLTVKAVFDGVGAAAKWVWEKILRPVFKAVGGFISENVAPSFKKGVEAIGKAWDGLRNAAKVPVKFLVETILNKGLLAGYNYIAKMFNVKPDNVQIKLPKGFAGGGVYPGYTPGRDVGMIGVSGGEAIMRPEWTRAVGPGYVDEANKVARSGGVGGVQRWLGGYADGGLIGRITGPLDRMRALGDSPWVQAIAAIPKAIAAMIVRKVTSLVELSSTGALGRASGVVGQGMGAHSYNNIIALARKSNIPFGVSSTLRNTNDYHGRGLAVDMYSSADNMAKLARWMYRLSNYELELIHSGGGGFFVKNGKRVGAGYYGGWAAPGTDTTIGQHYNHVHAAMTNPAITAARQALGLGTAIGFDSGGYIPPGVSTVYNGTGRPEAVLTDRQWRTQQQLVARAGGGTFTGNLVLDDGTFMGRIRGEMEAVADGLAGDLADARIYGG
jgi:hypothetical protein